MAAKKSKGKGKAKAKPATKPKKAALAGPSKPRAAVKPKPVQKKKDKAAPAMPERDDVDMESDNSDDSLPERIPEAPAGGAFRLRIPGGAHVHDVGHHRFGGKTIPPPPADEEEDEEEEEPRAWLQEEEEEEEEDDEEEEEVVPKITYWIKIYSLEEQAKALKHQDPETHVLSLGTNKPWADVYSLLKIQAVNTLFPNDAHVPDTAFRIKYTIPRHVKLPLQLSSDDDYDYMVNATQKMKNREVQIVIKQLTSLDADANKENAPPANAAAEGSKKTGKKSKAPSAKDLLPGNQAKLENIVFLRSRWHCNRDGCASTTCYIPPDGRHFPLGHDHIEKWADAILHNYQGEPSATLERPPNTSELDPVAEHSVVSRSPILQARLKAMQKEKGPQAPQTSGVTQPVINMVFPPNFGLGPAAALYPNGVQGQGQAQAQAGDAEPLIPPTFQPGFKMDMSTFTAAYKVPDSIVARLEKHRLTGTHAFAEMNTQHLENMEFLLGEVIDLKQAIKQWCLDGPMSGSSLSYC
ncbi:hypothetical protein CVT24_012146 [Panaeolus cyanescens]|uniref:Uncharacterized protein n=1 Tax=Panaeolus cyanescens TaxID=181874 RepID=A0A409YYQ8_9AGAR|nr:hypothetical protein CVT24_012146 [Panaeolus cyanescens]